MAQEEAYSTLIRGIQELNFEGPPVPSELLLNGHHAFPLAVNSKDQVMMAASCYGLGRIVVLGHETYLQDFPLAVQNALRWLQPSFDRAKIGVSPSCSDMVENLSSFDVEVCQFKDDLGIYVTDVYNLGPSAKDLVKFLKAGGGLLLAGQAWHWSSTHPEEKVLLHFPGNQVCGVAGIYITESFGRHEEIAVPSELPLKWSTTSRSAKSDNNLEFLLKNVSEFDIRGDAIPGDVLVHGPLAFPIATTPEGRAFLAGAQYGLGRVIVTTHEDFISYKTLSPFFLQALQWLDQGRNGTVGILPRLRQAIDPLSKSGLSCQVTHFTDGLSVYVCTSYSDDHCTEIQKFVAEGGGLLIGGHAWWWSYSNNAAEVLMKYPGNRILNQMGLSILTNIVDRELYNAHSGKELMEVYRFREFLPLFADYMVQSQSLSKDQMGCLEKMGRDCADYLSMSAHHCASYSSVLDTLTDVVKSGKVPQVSENRPVSDTEERMLLEFASEVCKVCPDPAALLPYIIKDPVVLPTVSNTKLHITAMTSGQEEWISTGLYLSPGMKTDIEFPQQIVGKSWKVQIGCQTDNLRKLDVLKRAPVVCESFPVDNSIMQVWNLWGGLIYLVAPRQCEVFHAEVVVQEAVRAPYYKSGETSIDDWVNTVRHEPAPWAELEFENLIITLDSKVIRDLERPDLVADQWNTIMRAVADLAAKPATFPRKERFVGDVQIACGWMHAGYPIMMHSGSARDLIKLSNKRDAWGPIHELGHNQQRSVWEISPNTTEATCELWPAYVFETVLGMHRAKAHDALEPHKRSERIQNYVKGGRNIKDWSVWVACETYLQLQEQFGWDAFKKVFAAYHDMEGVPNDNDGKMNTYAETFSKVVNRNLTSFFRAWGWPITAQTEKGLANLPVWSDHPMALYSPVTSIENTEVMSSGLCRVF
ncbi:TRPM8 channel-associated factor homolog [Engraulis encrasicolus]|uniref:TRPM8 channel-associated factor homolog n=1 Tax=Engraulis encrasicolus TaxID=184585 RepID=UPI002FD4C37D